MTVPDVGNKVLEVSCQSAATGTLSKEQALALQVGHKNRSLSQASDESVAPAGHGHGHHEKAPSILTAVASAVINYLLMFGLCCAYGMIMFEDDWNQRHRGLGVKMNLASALLMGLLLSSTSKISVAIGGPDLNPVVFLGMFVREIADDLAAQHGLTLPSENRRLLESCSEAIQALDPVEFLRRLGSADSGGSDFCIGSHYTANAAACDAYHAELRATTVFTVALSSALLGLLFFCLGRFRLTRFVSYVPTNIMEAFLSCVGYKVFKYALKFCKYNPKQFIPAAVIGVPLYFMKALHVGNPAIVIPLVLLTPLGIFYAAVYGSGSDLATVRDQKWMFPPIENADFWTIWTESVGSPGNINFKAWAATLPDLPIMVIVCLLDCMLKLSSTESKLPVKADKDYEAQLFGVGNAAIALCGSSVGYMQLKFNVINFGVIGNVKDRRGGVIYALLCGVCFFWTTDLFNYLPRFFLSTLLFFAGAGFVAENLWGSRKYLTIAEWLQIFLILAVFIIFHSLLYAVIAGGLITGMTFILRYAKIPCMMGRPMTGAEVCSLERCSLPLTRRIKHIADSWVVVVRMKGFIFFASAEAVTAWVMKHCEKRCTEEVPRHSWPHWILMDCDQLDGLDCSASKSFSKMAHGIMKDYGVRVCWSGLNEQLHKQLSACDVISSSSHSFKSQVTATQYFERSICRYAVKQQEKWVTLHPLFSLAHRMMNERMAFEPFEDVFKADVARFGCPWKYCGRLKIEANSTVLWRPGETQKELFLVHTGSVGLLASVPGGGPEGSDEPKMLQVCRRGRFLNYGALLGAPTSLHAVALEDGELLYWNQAQWATMKREQPYMASAILEAVLEQKHAEYRHVDELTAAADAGADPALPASAEVVTEKLASWGKGIATADALGNLGLFDPPGNDSAPMSAIPVPTHLETELRTAFRTYCRFRADGKPSLPLDKAGDALMYAGIFGAAESVEAESLALEEFVALGGRLAMMQLSSQAREKLQDMFVQFEKGDSGLMNTAGLAAFIQEKVHSGISVDEVAGLASLVSNSSAGQLNAATFLAVMSRLARKHELHWFVLQGARDLLGRAEGIEERLTPKMLVSNAKSTKLTEEEAEELIWAANVTGETDAALDARLLPLVLAPIHVPKMELPPEPIEADSAAQCTTTSSSQSPLLKRMNTDFRDLSMEKIVSLAPRLGKRDMPSTKVDDVPVTLEDAEEEEQLPTTCRAKVNLFLDEPQSSQLAGWWSVVMGVMILVSILTLFLEPLIHPRQKPRSPTANAVWGAFEIYFTVIFSLELLVRFAVADALGTQTFAGFLVKPMNICDFLSVLPLYINAAVDDSREEFRLFRLVRFLRLARLVRLGRLATMSQTFAPIAMILVVIWGIFLQSGLED